MTVTEFLIGANLVISSYSKSRDPGKKIINAIVRLSKSSSKPSQVLMPIERISSILIVKVMHFCTHKLSF